MVKRQEHDDVYHLFVLQVNIMTHHVPSVNASSDLFVIFFFVCFGQSGILLKLV